MAEAIYLLCACTSLLCAVLLLRSYRETRTQVLLSSGLCFVGLTINNMLLVVDLVVVPDTDLSPVRTTVAMIAMATLVLGLVWGER